MFRRNLLILLIAFSVQILLITCTNTKKYVKDEKNIKKFEVKDPHSYSNPDKISVKHIELDLEIFWDTKILGGTATLFFDRRDAGKHPDTLILDTRDLQIQKITSLKGNERKWWFEKTDSIFGTALCIELAKTDSIVTITYKTKSAAALQWLTPAQTHDKTDPFLYSQSQAILARTWIPCQDAPAVKFTYNARVKTLPGYLALMSATNPQTTNDSGIYHFVMEQPISSYLLALSSGKIEFKSLGYNCGIYAEPGMLANAAWEFADMQKMVDAAGKLYGTYMWKRYDLLVLPPSFPFGGMENPRLTFATPTVITGDRSQVSLVAHELAHSWSGNLVTNSTWNDFWLNEGFTTYFEQRIMEQLYGKEYEQMRKVLSWGDLLKTINELKADNLMQDSKLQLDLTGRDPDDGLSDIAYEKGRFFLCHLESVVGRENWDAFLKKYFSSHAFSYMDTKGFAEYLNEELLNKNKDWQKKANINGWIYEEGLPQDAIKPVSAELNKVDATLKLYSKGIIKPESFDTSGFTSFHWQYLIREFSKTATLAQVTSFDKVFHFSNRGNSEICCDWFALSIKVGYLQNRPQISNFLCSVGRRKFLMPIYEALSQKPADLNWAKSVFEKAKSGYHSVSEHSVKELLY